MSIQQQSPFRVAIKTLHESEREDALDHLKCELNLRVRIEAGQVIPIRFRVDTGASHSLMPLVDARFYGIPIPNPAQREILLLNTAGGQTTPVEVIRGLIRVWWDAGRKGTPFDWPIMFLVNARSGATPLLGLGRILPDCQWFFDGTAEEDAPHGTATFTDIRSTTAIS